MRTLTAKFKTDPVDADARRHTIGDMAVEWLDPPDAQMTGLFSFFTVVPTACVR